MIRQDYILRQVQELAQVLARALFLRVRGEYEAALGEIGKALRQIEAGDPDGLTAEGWLALCRRHEGVTGPLMLAVADLLREQAASREAGGRSAEAGRSRDSALALQLETVLAGAAPVTRERLDQIDADVAAIPVEVMSSATLSRVFAYQAERGRWAAAEDALFDWAERGEASARTAGRAFYARLGQLSPEELAAGGFSRDEVASGLADLERTEARGRD